LHRRRRLKGKMARTKERSGRTTAAYAPQRLAGLPPGAVKDVQYTVVRPAAAIASGEENRLGTSDSEQQTLPGSGSREAIALTGFEVGIGAHL
jgi:hypothetical protein